MRNLRSSQRNVVNLEPKMRGLRSKKWNCLNLGLSDSATCDICKRFKQWLSDLSGRKPSKNDVPNCEHLWKQDPTISGGRLLVQERAKKEVKALGLKVRESSQEQKELTKCNSYLVSH